MSQKKTIVVAHGIGDAQAGFEKDWEPVLKGYARTVGVEINVVGLWWNGLQQELARKYPDISTTAQDVATQLGFPQLKTTLGNASYLLVQEYYKDLFFYLYTEEMSTVLLNGAADILHGQVGAGEESRTILIGHSLGAAMLPHMLWWRFGETGAVPYHSLLLLASPLSICSPLTSLVPDLLLMMRRLTPRQSITNRLEMLNRFTALWCGQGDQRLTFIANRNDLVCSDVVYADPIPNLPPLFQNGQILPSLRKSFNAEERAVLLRQQQQALTFETGENRLRAIADNHDVQRYLASEPFRQTFTQLLTTD